MVKAVIFDMYETLITLWHSAIYMGHEISADAGIDEAKFREIWDATDYDRATGKRSYEDVIEEILRVNGRYSQELFELLVSKRIASKAESFNYVHEDIIPMLEALKKAGIKIGLITNCFSEERAVIIESVLYPYFDVVCMSCEVGLIKPDRKIYELCLDKLDLEPGDCLYCGDGGSHELEAALSIGMHPVQACWYLQEGSGQPTGRKPEFIGAMNPMDIVKLAKEYPL